MITNRHDPYLAQRQPARLGEAVREPANWRPEDFADNDAWLYRFRDDEIEELDAAIAPYDRPGVDLLPLDRSAFPLPGMAERLRGGSSGAALWPRFCELSRLAGREIRET